MVSYKNKTQSFSHRLNMCFFMCIVLANLSHAHALSQNCNTIHVDNGEAVPLHCGHESNSSCYVGISDNSTGEAIELTSGSPTSSNGHYHRNIDHVVNFNNTDTNKVKIVCFSQCYDENGTRLRPEYYNYTCFVLKSKKDDRVNNTTTALDTTQTTDIEIKNGGGEEREEGGGGGGHLGLILGVLALVVFVICCGAVALILYHRKSKQKEDAGTGATASQSQSNGHRTPSNQSNILLISEECTDTGNNPNSSVPLSREQSISRIPEEVSVYEEDQCIEGRERLIVQCTDSDEQSITTVGVCSAQEIQYRSVGDRYRSSFAGQQDSPLALDAPSEPVELSEVAACREDETTTWMYTSPVESTRSGVRKRQNKRTVTECVQSDEDVDYSHGKPFSQYFIASNYSEEVSSSVEKFDSQFCYPEQDSLNHFLRDLHVVYEDRRAVFSEDDDNSEDDSFDRDIPSSKKESHAVNVSSYIPFTSLQSFECFCPSPVVQKHVAREVVNIPRDLCVFNSREFRKREHDTLPKVGVVSIDQLAGTLSDEHHSVKCEHHSENEQSTRIYIPESLPDNTITNKHCKESPHLMLHSERHQSEPHFIRQSTKTIRNSTPKEPPSIVSNSSLSRQSNTSDHFSAPTGPPSQVSNPLTKQSSTIDHHSLSTVPPSESSIIELSTCTCTNSCSTPLTQAIYTMSCSHSLVH